MRICKVKNCEAKHRAKGYCSRHYDHYYTYGKILKRTNRDPNEIIDCGDYYEICLYNREHKEVARTKIDNEDVDKVKKYKWSLDNLKYVCSNKIRLHQLILGRKQGYEIDHINHDPLDNRKQNLRHCTHQQNMMNRNGFHGIYFDKSRNKWRVYIAINCKYINLGRFKNKKDAIKVRREAELKYYGEFAYKH